MTKIKYKATLRFSTLPSKTRHCREAAINLTFLKLVSGNLQSERKTTQTGSCVHINDGNIFRSELFIYKPLSVQQGSSVGLK